VGPSTVRARFSPLKVVVRGGSVRTVISWGRRGGLVSRKALARLVVVVGLMGLMAPVDVALSSVVAAAERPAVECTGGTINGNFNSDIGALTGCSRRSTGGTTAIIAGNSIGGTNETVTWANGKTTTWSGPPAAPTSSFSCNLGQQPLTTSGTVTAGTNHFIRVGSPVQVNVCLASFNPNLPSYTLAVVSYSFGRSQGADEADE